MKKARLPRLSLVLMAAGLALLLAAAGLLGFNLWDGRRAEMSAQRILAQMPIAVTAAPANNEPQLQAAAAAEPAPAASEALLHSPQVEMPTVSIEGQDYIGLLEIPALELALPVLGQCSDALLKIAPCRYDGSAYGTHLVIAAHNYAAHFGSLSALQPGDRITFTDVEGYSQQYTVAGLETLSSTDVEAMTDETWPLTLFTCTLGNQSRITVRCLRAEDVSAPGDISPQAQG